MDSLKLLGEINAVQGVDGCFLVDSKGGVLARAMPQAHLDAILASVGKMWMQTFAAIEQTHPHKPGELDLVFEDRRMLVKPLSEDACLIIVCTPRVNAAMLKLTADAVAEKLRDSSK